VRSKPVFNNLTTYVQPTARHYNVVDVVAALLENQNSMEDNKLSLPNLDQLIHG
jgi:hypothetical protein